MGPMAEKIGRRYHIALVILCGAAAMLLLPHRAQAAQQALFSDGQGGNYCDGTCKGSGCCDDKVIIM
jgi:hypothetical protein